MDHGTNFIVEAAAGTGKTSLMAGRVAMMMADGKLPAEIAAITFTELAASELQRRIHETVGQLLAREIPDPLRTAIPKGLTPTQHAKLEFAAQKLDDLTTTTIHGFCQAIIRSHAVEANLDPGARVVDETVADAIFDEVFSSWLIDRLALNSQETDPIVLLAQDDPLTVVALVKELAQLRRRHPTATAPSVNFGERADIDLAASVLDFERWVAANPVDGVTSTIVAELGRLAGFFSECFAQEPTFADLWRLTKPPRVDWMARSQLGLRRYQRLQAWKNIAGEDLGSRLNDEAGALFEAVDRNYRRLLGVIGQAMATQVSQALDDVVEGYRRQKRAAAVLDFDDLLLRARELVTKHEAVRRAVGDRYRHILVDEFQDTDRIQAEMLFFIGAESPPENWRQAVLRPGALFLVGDPKQAIYRFRGADIAAYWAAKSALTDPGGGQLLHITANFRSRSEIVEHVNTCFASVLGKEGQPGYVALSATTAPPEHELACATRLTVDLPPKSSAEQQRDAEAQTVAQACVDLIGRLSITRADRTKGRARAGDIALLAPTGTDLWRYERALEERGISVASQAGKALMRRQETQDVLAIVRVLVDSSDTLAFGSVMRGPMVGLSDTELLDIALELGANNVDHAGFTVRTDADAVSHPVAKSVLVVLQELRRRAPHVTPSVLLAEAIEKLHLRVVLSARYGSKGARALSNLDALIEMARGHAIGGLQAFVEDLQQKWEGRESYAEGRSDTSEDAVEIVTMHSAKGLEWPIVIPINTATRFRPPAQFVHRLLDDTLHWIIGGVIPPDLEKARTEEGQSEALERERIWYVACTRARELLVIPSLTAAEASSWSRVVNLRTSTLPELDLSSLPEAAVVAREVAENVQTAERYAVEADMVRASVPAIIWRRPSVHDADSNRVALDGPIELDEVGERARVVGGGFERGNVLHKLIEELLTGELDETLEAVSERAAHLLDQLMPLRRQTPGSGASPPHPREVAETALRTFGMPAILPFRARLMPEVSIWASEGENYLAGRADAVVMDGDRVDLVIDWKSDVSPSASTRRDHLDQLSEYVEATGARLGAIVYMSLGEISWVGEPREGLK